MVVIMSCLVLVAGCTESPRTQGSGGGSSAPSSSAREVGDLSVEALVGDDVLLKATVHPIERLSDHVVLTIDFTYSEDSQSYSEFDVLDRLRVDGAHPTFSVSGIRLVDFPRDRVWEPGWVGNWSATAPSELKLDKKGQVVTSVTLFGSVGVDAVDVLIPHVGLVNDVPVVEAGPDTIALAKTDSTGPVFYAQPFTLDSLVRSYDDGTSVQKQGDAQTVVMASDVLFATDVAELSPEAAARVDEVAGQIAQVASGGEVRVVGHTDDVLSEEYNLDLSARRATSVADRMTGVLGSSFTVAKEGKGESEPAVEGTDDAARAANRRVEIEFTAPEAVELSQTQASIPEATGPVGTGHDPVTYTVDDAVYSVEVPSVVRREDYLVGTLVVTHVSGESSINGNFLSNGVAYSGQKEYSPYVSAVFHNANNVVLMGPQGGVFPTRYWKERDSGPQARLLADETLGGGYYLPIGEVVTYTVVWPDTGGDSVTIESPLRFRVADIPVEETS